MKQEIHPEFYPECQVKYRGEVVMTVGATVPELNVEIWSGSHPFYTGKSSFVDTAGRVEKFQKGHIKYCGETALQLMDVGFSTAVKKLGTIGCTVRIMRPGAKLPHEITIQERSESGLPDLVEASGFVPLDLEEALERAAREEE